MCRSPAHPRAAARTGPPRRSARRSAERVSLGAQYKLAEGAELEKTVGAEHLWALPLQACQCPAQLMCAARTALEWLCMPACRYFPLPSGRTSSFGECGLPTSDLLTHCCFSDCLANAPYCTCIRNQFTLKLCPSKAIIRFMGRKAPSGTPPRRACRSCARAHRASCS